MIGKTIYTFVLGYIMYTVCHSLAWKKKCAVPLRETKTVRHFRFACISLAFNKIKENGEAAVV